MAPDSSVTWVDPTSVEPSRPVTVTVTRIWLAVAVLLELEPALESDPALAPDPELMPAPTEPPELAPDPPLEPAPTPELAASPTPVPLAPLLETDASGFDPAEASWPPAAPEPSAPSAFEADPEPESAEAAVPADAPT